MMEAKCIVMSKWVRVCKISEAPATNNGDPATELSARGLLAQI